MGELTTKAELKVLRAKLKAYFAAQTMDVEDTGGSYDQTYGYPEGLSLEAINDAIDAFDPDAIN